MSFFSAARLSVMIFMLGLLGACTGVDDLSEPPAPMGTFLLGHNIVIAKDTQKGPLSREASEEELEKAVKSAIDARFGRYEGSKYFHIGTHIDAYNLAVPGIPLIAAPKSVLIITINVWDDSTGQKLTAEPKQLTVFEHSEKNTFVLGSGLTNSREAQIENLSKNAARMIQRFLLENPEWFGLPPLEPKPEDSNTTKRAN